jgi:putative SbcD/Mre11-related phosphoesterase
MVYPVTPWPSLVIEQDSSKILVVTDLHLGFEYQLSVMGINIPSQTPKIQSKLLKIVKEVRPSRLVLLGDVKHSISKISLQEWKELPAFFESVLDLVDTIDIIPGNHDGDLTPLTPRSIRISSARGIIIDGDEQVGVFHGHAWPKINLLNADYLVMGHNHPVIYFEDNFGYRTVRRVWIKASIDLEKLRNSSSPYKELKSKDTSSMIPPERKNLPIMRRLIIMPAFNDMLGGLQMNGKPSNSLLGPLLRSGCVDIDNAEAYLLDGSYLGTIDRLRRLVRTRQKEGTRTN